MDTLERIKKLFVANYAFKEDYLTPDAALDSFGLDSLDKTELMFELENEFNIKIPGKITITTIQDLVDLIAKLISEQHET